MAAADSRNTKPASPILSAGTPAAPARCPSGPGTRARGPPSAAGGRLATSSPDDRGAACRPRDSTRRESRTSSRRAETVRRQVRTQVVERDGFFGDEALRAPVVVLDVGRHVVQARRVCSTCAEPRAPTARPRRRRRPDPRPGPTCVCYLTKSRATEAALRSTVQSLARVTRGEEPAMGRWRHVLRRLAGQPAPSLVRLRAGAPGAAGPGRRRGAAPPAQNPTSFFITSVGKGDGANYGGLAGADAYCAQLAQARQPADPAGTDLARLSERGGRQRPAVGERPRSHRRRARGTTRAAR